MESARLSEEPLTEGDMAFIEVGKKHSGKFVVGKITTITKQPAGDIAYYHERHWNHLTNAFALNAMISNAPLSQCTKVILSEVQS